MSLGELLHRLPTDTRKVVRSIEQANRKLSKSRSAVLFNRQCLNENILPTYTNIRLHDPAVKQAQFTNDYRKKLVENQIEVKLQLIEDLEAQLRNLYEKLHESSIPDETKNDILEQLDTNAKNSFHVNKLRVSKKLSNLYGANVTLPEESHSFVNLSSVELSNSQIRFLDLGLNCHFQSSYDQFDKKTEIELLYREVRKLQDEGEVDADPRLKDQLVAESSKRRGSTRSKVLTKEMREAARQLREDERIIIRRADKSATYVVMDRDEYLRKMQNILNDKSKFERISSDPTASLKAEVNRLITAANAVIGGVHFEKISGEYGPGYAYGNVKIHKENKPLRPIISQIPSPLYRLAKRLNKLLKPYVPAKYSLESSEEFIDILRVKRPSGILASIDVESLFTNVPIEETIKIILKEVFQNPNSALPPLNLTPWILEKMLRSCTTETPFRGPDGLLYRQKDGVAMGSPLGPLFASFYMSAVENSVLSDITMAPSIYCRYVDDVFVDVQDEDHLNMLISCLEERSVLHFTSEVGIRQKIPFLDVEVDASGGNFSTDVYRKQSNSGNVMNAQSECPDRYKKSVLRAFIKRALRHCSSYIALHAELTRMKQILLNNGYSNSEIDKEINEQMEKQASHEDTEDKPAMVRLYYRNFMNTAYKDDERALRNIITSNVICKDKDKKLQLTIYYKNKKTRNLVMRNNTNNISKPSKSTNVVYKFTCSHEDCRPQTVSYIGATTTTLSRRLTMHKTRGAIKDHIETVHRTQITRQILDKNTEVLRTVPDQKRLWILEALYLREYSPVINVQGESNEELTLWRDVY